MSTFWQEVPARPREIFEKLSRGQRIGVMALVSVGVVIAVLSGLLAGRESWKVLYGGLDPAAANEIVSQLSSTGVPYQITPEGTTVMVPEQRVNEVRMQLAAAGLPKSGSHGFEIFDATQFGMTDALFNVNMQRALQGTLEQTIESLDGVRKARVIIQLQQKSIYASNDAPRSTASVALSLRPGMPLTDANYGAIAHLVAFSVGHGMRVQDVAIIDSESHLLYPRGDRDDPTSSLARLAAAQAIEKARQEAAESQLRAAVGPGKASVRVSIELDPTYKETKRETLSDENRAKIRESSSTDGSGSARGGSGGTLTAGKPAEVASGDHHEEKDAEYRDGVEHELEITAAGSIRHMSVSLLLDESDPSLKDKAEKLGDLVKSAVGFVNSKTRKDDFQVLAIPFQHDAAAAPMPGPFALETLLPLAGHLTEAVTVLFVLFLLLKVARGGSGGAVSAKTKSKGAAGAGAGGDAAGEENEFTELTYAADGKSGDLRTRLTRFVTKHPEQAREVLLAWLKEEMSN